MTMTAAKSKALGLKIAARWRQEAIDLDSQFGAVKVRLNSFEQLLTTLEGDLQNGKEMEEQVDDAKKELQIVISSFQNIVQHLQARHLP